MPYSCNSSDDGKEDYLGIRGHDCIKSTVAGLDWQTTTCPRARMRTHFSHAVFTLKYISVHTCCPSPSFLFISFSCRAVWQYGVVTAVVTTICGCSIVVGEWDMWLKQCKYFVKDSVFLNKSTLELYA